MLNLLNLKGVLSLYVSVNVLIFGAIDYMGRNNKDTSLKYRLQLVKYVFRTLQYVCRIYSFFSLR